VFLFEFVGKDFFFLAAIGTLAAKGLQMLVGLESGAMLWCGHDISPFAKRWESKNTANQAAP
jgi:hypothetical protein